jgi:hypothetical protein
LAFIVSLIVINALTAQHMYAIKTELADTHRQLTISMNEGYELRTELKAMTLEAHPYTVNGQVGPTASLELQCLQFKGLLPHPDTKAD